MRGYPWAVGLRAIPDGLRATPLSINRPEGRVTPRYTSGHGVVAAHSRVYVWRSWGPIPGRGSPGRWPWGLHSVRADTYFFNLMTIEQSTCISISSSD